MERKNIIISILVGLASSAGTAFVFLGRGK